MSSTSGWHVGAMTAARAAQVCTWTYPAPYDRYSTDGAAPATFVDPGNCFVALLDAQDDLVGYRSFGPDGRVPGGPYDDTALDTGGALRPDLTGRGLGRDAIRTGLAYGRDTWAPAAFRVTVWAQNTRALTVVRSLGFTGSATFVSARTQDQYVVLRREE